MVAKKMKKPKKNEKPKILRKSEKLALQKLFPEIKSERRNKNGY